MRSTWKLMLQLMPILLVSLFCKADDNGCTASHNVDELRQLRLEQLKNNILAQLGFTEVPTLPSELEEESEDEDSDIVESYNQLVNDSLAESKCTSGDFYAKPINSFVGVLSPAEGLVSRYRRALKSEELEAMGHPEELEVVIEAGILNQYTISVDFDLPQNMSHISRANLVLHQDTANTIEDEVLDRYQLVQIRTVIDNIRYFVEKKSVDVYSHGLQSFDVTRAVELWVQEGVSRNAILEVLVTCYSSPNCSEGSPGKLPAKVSFDQNTSDPSKLPRIITISKNPLEQDNESYRSKRQAETTTEPEFCSANQTTCCLQPLTINFKEDLAFSFVSKPKTFKANFCDGYCPEVAGIGLMSSQRFQLLRYLSSSPTSSIEPCCTGLEYKPLQILVSIYNPATQRTETRLDRLDQVTVTKCRCG